MASPCQHSLPGKLTARAQGGQATVGRSLHWAGPGEDGPWGKDSRGNGDTCRDGKRDIVRDVDSGYMSTKAGPEKNIGFIIKLGIGAGLVVGIGR